ncbi:MAG: hypothetical protein V5B40_06080 [Candidatus Accumulibacter meliphilus]|jgi:hypothetical protein|uniref:hypothetical protein n=1 Tax=Candidatus Accumulibacter meliphilus TaxID=2211374 RepID=UPI002FC345C7
MIMHPLASHLSKLVLVGLGVPIAIVVIPLLLVFVAGVHFGPKEDFWRNREEVLRVASPVENIDTVLVETNGGATTSFGYEVYLVAKGENIEGKPRVAFVYGATRNENAYGVNLKWRTPNLLSVEYYRDKGIASEVNTPLVIGNMPVEVVIQTGVLDTDAAPGGMGFNQRRRK